jgi:2OG-Fe(II) oxygenase superfamily
LKQIFVHDTAVPTSVLEGVQAYFAQNVRWNFGWPQGLNDPFSHWNIDFLGTQLKSQANVESSLFDKPELAAVADVWRALKAGPMRGHYLLRCYANAHTFGVEGYPHTDIVDASQVDNFTAVVYLNPVWKKEWAGELVLFNAAGDTLCGILPRAGRAALIPGDIVHAARGVSRQCPAVRICVAFKSRLPTAAELLADGTAEPLASNPFVRAADISPTAVGANNTASPHSDSASNIEGVNLYLDPNTQRVAYFSAGEDLPTRIFVYEGAKQNLERVFVPELLSRVRFSGALPARMYAQNSWNYRLVDGAVVLA